MSVSGGATWCLPTPPSFSQHSVQFSLPSSILSYHSPKQILYSLTTKSITYTEGLPTPRKEFKSVETEDVLFSKSLESAAQTGKVVSFGLRFLILLFYNTGGGDMGMVKEKHK